MAITLTDNGGLEILDTYLNNARPAGGNNHTLFLFTNDVTPTDATVTGDLIEAAGGGYAAKTLTNGSWTVALNAGIPEATYAQQTWNFTGALTGNPTIYGYGVKDADGTLVYAERHSAAFTPVNGAVLNVPPKLKASKGTPA